MSSIRVNYQAADKRTSTTFTDIMARNFIRAWYGMQRLLEEVGEEFAITDKDDQCYRDIAAVKTTFQQCVNHMTDYVDAIHTEQGHSYDGWTKRELEYYMLFFIRGQAAGDYLNNELISWD